MQSSGDFYFLSLVINAVKRELLLWEVTWLVNCGKEGAFILKSDVAVVLTVAKGILILICFLLL